MKSDRQSGSIMLLTLLMLMFLQFVAVAVVNSANISSHVLRNFESAVAVERGADNLINYVLGNKDYFVNYSNYLNGDGQFEIPIPDDLIAEFAIGKISSFQCLHNSTGAESIADTGLCDLNSQYWQLIVEVVNPQTGANTTVVQGLKLTIDRPSDAPTEGDFEERQDNPAPINIQRVWWYAQ